MTQFRKQAAVVAKVPPRRLSFKRVWTTFNVFLWRWSPSVSGWGEQYDKALRLAAKSKIPNRPDRSYERESYSLRPKSNHFKKRTPKPLDPLPDL